MRKTFTSLLSLLIMLLLVQTALLAAVKIDSDDRRAQELTYFAINGSKVFHIPDEIDTTVVKRLGWMQELGVKWDRSDWWWHVIEPKPGQFDFSFPDKVVELYKAHGIQILPILCYGRSGWEHGNAPYTEEYMRQFANFVYETVRHHEDDFTYWAIWNEPNILPFWSPEPNVEHYAQLLKLSYEAAKRADPDCKILAPVTAGFDRKFIERLYQLGGKDYFDVFDYHYYRHHPPEKDVPREIAAIRALMHRFGDDKPIWITETGVTSPVDKQPESYDRQAMLIVRNHLLCLAEGVERIFYFDLQNWYDDPEESWDSFLGLVQANDLKKPSFYAYQTMIREVDYKDFVGRYRQLGSGIEAVLIHDPVEDIYSLAVWTEEDRHARFVDIYCEPGDVRIVELYGEEQIIPLEAAEARGMKQRAIRLEVNQRPRYISPVSPEIYLAEAGINFSPGRIEISPDDSQPLRIEIHPLLREFSYRITDASIPKGFDWNPSQAVFHALADAKEAPHKLHAHIELTRGRGRNREVYQVERTLDVALIPKYKLDLRPYLEDDQLKVQALLGNRTTRTVSGPIRLEEIHPAGNRLLGEKTLAAIPAGGEGKVDFHVPIEVPRSYTQTTAWQLVFEDIESKPFRIYVAPLRNEAPQVDGNLEEWTSIPALHLNEQRQVVRGLDDWTPEQASAEVKLWATPDALYFGARVTDSAPMVNPHLPVELWKGDAFELYLGFDGPTRRGSLNKDYEFQLGLAPTSAENRPVVFQFHEDVELTGAKLVAVPQPDGYLVEVSLPLSELGEFKLKDGMLLGFDVALDDYDPSDIERPDEPAGRALMWNGTGMNWIDPSGWGMMVLKKE